jgi:hypothetical protein
VGIVVAHNELFDAPHSAIMLSGNDHLIEYNSIHDVCKETGDAGAIYMGRDLTQRGIIVRYNAISNLVSEVQESPSNVVRGVYLDDFTSGVTLYGNIFYRVSRGIDIGCGRDNSIRNNIFIECNPGIWFSKRGWDGKNTWRYGEFSETIIKNLQAVPYQSKIWNKRYPKLTNILEDQFGVPKGNEVTNNIYTRCELITLFPEATDSLIHIGANYSINVPQEYSLSSEKIRYLNSVHKKGFERIPIEKIGPEQIR